MIDPAPLWQYDDPTGSEARLRNAADHSPADREAWLTQVARALGLRRRYAEGHQLLDGLDVSDPEVATRAELERGRLLRTSGDAGSARAHFAVAAGRAREAGLEELEVDALHMLALCVPPEKQVEAHLAALHAARTASDPRARDWDASVLNNLGTTLADMGDHRRALVVFEEALAARERIGDVGRIRVARWMLAWSLRHLGHHQEALALQRALQAELSAEGQHDSHVDEEIALLER